jgi:hypothetical protein
MVAVMAGMAVVGKRTTHARGVGRVGNAVFG